MYLLYVRLMHLSVLCPITPHRGHVGILMNLIPPHSLIVYDLAKSIKLLINAMPWESAHMSHVVCACHVMYCSVVWQQQSQSEGAVRGQLQIGLHCQESLVTRQRKLPIFVQHQNLPLYCKGKFYGTHTKPRIQASVNTLYRARKTLG